MESWRFQSLGPSPKTVNSFKVTLSTAFNPWLNCVHLQKRYIEVLMPSTPNVTLFGNRVLTEVTKINKVIRVVLTQ